MNEINVDPAVPVKDQIEISLSSEAVTKRGIEIGVDPAVASKDSIEVVTGSITNPKEN